MKKILVLIIVFSLFIFGCSKTEEINKEKEFVRPSREVRITKALQKEMISYLEYSGRLEAKNVVNISPAFSAKIEKLNVTEGSRVKKGDLLAKLDDSQLAQTEAQFANLQKNYQRMQKLLETGSIDERTYEEVETAYLAMKESLDFMRENTRITAPVNGIISKIMAKEGETFNSMMNPFFIRLINLENMLVKVNISDADLSKVTVGQKVYVDVDKNSFEYVGKLSYVSPEADMMSGTFECGIVLNNLDKELKHNQFAKVKIVVYISDDAVVVPQKAVMEDGIIFVANNGKAELRNVVVGLQNEDEKEILSGVIAGEEIIVIGIVGLNDGDPIKVIK